MLKTDLTNAAKISTNAMAKLGRKEEVDEKVVVSKMEIPTQHGAIPGKMQNSPTNYYNFCRIQSKFYSSDTVSYLDD